MLTKIIPALGWSKTYQRENLIADSVAGTVVLFITVPQVIAYAFLAGLPPAMGLYAAMLALFGYALFGSSRTLAVGPTAIIAMMTLETVSHYAEPGSAAFANVAMKLGLLTGLVLLLLRVVNFGAVISFLSHAVVSGFISAAAILIMINQLPTLLGIGSAPATDVVSVSRHLVAGASALNVASFGIGISAMLVLWFFRAPVQQWLSGRGIAEAWTNAIVKSAPMYVVILGIVLVAILQLDQAQAVAVVGDIPGSLPVLQQFDFDLDELRELLPSALLIAMVVFMESTSIGAAVAAKRREKIEPNQELVGLGVANVASALGGGFPVAGSFARTLVNFSSGASTQVAGLITALLVLLTLFGFAGLFYYLPKSILSAIILMSAWQLIDWHVIGKIFSFNRTDAVTFVFTFASVLILGVESGILMGIAISFVLLIRSSSKPHIAVVGRWQGSEHFRNVLRHEVATLPHVLAVRIDESFYFVNTRYIETFLLNQVADSPEVEHILLICTATNFIDTSGLEMLELLSDNLEEVGVTLHLAEVKGPVMDKLKETDFYRRMKGDVFFTTDIAMKTLAGLSNRDSHKASL